MASTRFRFPCADARHLPRHLPRRRPVVLGLVAAALVACGERAPELTPGTGQFRGAEVAAPRPKPTFTLRDTDGRPYDFARETAGAVTLLFFGYTHCPDICPVHLANIGAVLKRLDPADRQRIRVVFVTTDPDRDSAAVIRRWLDNFDPAFVGLRGSLDEVNAIQAQLRLPPAAVTTNAKGQVEVSHAAVVLAFDAAGLWRLSYPFGTRQDDWAHDLPLLVRGRWRAAGPAAARDASGGETMFVGKLRFDDARVPVLRGTAALAAYATIRNSGADDWLLGVEAPGLARTAMLHGQSRSVLGQATMTMLDSLPLPSGGTLALAPGGQHVMLEGLMREPDPGDRVPLVFRFRLAGRVSVPARAVPPDAAQGSLR